MTTDKQAGTERVFGKTGDGKFYRVARPDILELVRWSARIALAEGQAFYETPKAYEIWQEDPLLRIKRISKKSVVWILPR